jgi:hypothetical protein
MESWLGRGVLGGMESWLGRGVLAIMGCWLGRAGGSTDASAYGCSTQLVRALASRRDRRLGERVGYRGYLRA